MAYSRQSLQDLDLTRDEVERLGNALKDKEFRKLLVDYVEEIQDPENRKIYESEISQLERERGVDVTFINPVAGYVIKTSVNGCKKGFINICSNENVKKPISTPTYQDGVRGLQWSLPHSISPPREDIDNRGQRCQVFDIVFHPDTLHLAKNNTAFRDMVNKTATEAIEANFDVTLDTKNLKFPKLQYKGMPYSTVIRKPTTEKIPEKSPEDQAILDKLYENIPKPDFNKKSKKYVKKPEEKNNYTTPKYLIKHRSHLEIEDFTYDKNSKINAAIPKELILEVQLPLLKSASDIILDVAEKSVQLNSEKPAKYKLSLNLPYVVDQDNGNAKFDKDLKKLIITLPVKRSHINMCDLNRDDSGVESDHGSPVSKHSDDSIENTDTESDDSKTIDSTGNSDLIKVKRSELSKNKMYNARKNYNCQNNNRDFNCNGFHSENKTFLNPNLQYVLPEVSCFKNENLLIFTIHVKNVDENSIEKTFNDAHTMHLKFTNIGSSFFPIHYSTCINLSQTINPESVSVEAWDNNVILQISCDDVNVIDYKVGLTEHELTTKLIEQNTPKTKEVQSDDLEVQNHPSEQPVGRVKEVQKANVVLDTVALKDEPSRAIDISGFGSESSGDELSCSYSPSKSKGILKRISSSRSSVSRSISESSIDDLMWTSSFENCYNSMDSVIPEDGEVSSSFKKTVRFNDNVTRQLFRSNSSILGQKKKNQRKAKNKKRAQERRCSESELSESEEKKERDPKTKESEDDEEENKKEDNNIFEFDM